MFYDLVDQEGCQGCQWDESVVGIDREQNETWGKKKHEVGEIGNDQIAWGSEGRGKKLGEYKKEQRNYAVAGA